MGWVTICRRVSTASLSTRSCARWSGQPDPSKATLTVADAPKRGAAIVRTPARIHGGAKRGGTMATLDDPRLRALLKELHARSEAQDPLIGEYYRTRPREGRAVYPEMDAGDHAHFADKMVALEPDKAEFCYRLCRAMG